MSFPHANHLDVSSVAYPSLPLILFAQVITDILGDEGLLETHIRTAVDRAIPFAFAFLSLFFSTPAMAIDNLEVEDRQELVQNIMMACLEARHLDAWNSCIGVPAAGCVENMRPASVSYENACLREELRQWEIQMKGLYSTLKRDVRRQGGERPSDAVSFDESLSAMRKMQTNWIEYKKSACAYLRTFLVEGSKYAEREVSRCEMQIAASHVIWLFNLRERYLVN